MNFKSLDTFYAYPHRTMSSLPTEMDVINVINGSWESGISNGKAESRLEVLNIFNMNWGGYNSELMDGSNNPPRTEYIDQGSGLGKSGLDGCVHAILDRLGLFMERDSKL